MKVVAAAHCYRSTIVIVDHMSPSIGVARIYDFDANANTAKLVCVSYSYFPVSSLLKNFKFSD